MDAAKLNAAQIYRQVCCYHLGQVRWFCQLARDARPAPQLRAHMLARAREEAKEIKDALRAWRLS